MVRHNRLVIVRHERLGMLRGTDGQTERKTRGVADSTSRTSEARTACFSIGRARPHGSRTLAQERLRSGGREGVADLIESRRSQWRQRAVVRLVLGILRTLLRRPLWARMALVARAVVASPCREYGH